MTWLRVDDTFGMDERVIAAGNAAAGLWLRAGTWSMQQLTDGHVPKVVAKQLGKPSEIRALLDHNLWEEDTSGYSFLKWDQPRSEDVLARRSANAKRQASHRKKRSESGETNE